MAKEQSKFSRLDGLTRIPLPGSIRTSYKPTKLSRPSVFSGLRPPSAPILTTAPATAAPPHIQSSTISMASMPKSISGDRINEKNQISCLIDNKNQKHVDVLKNYVNKTEKYFNDLIEDKTTAKKTFNCIKKSTSLTRSETFIRDRNSISEENNVTSTIPSVPEPAAPAPVSLSSAGVLKTTFNSTPKTAAVNSSALFLTRTIDTTMTPPKMETTMTLEAASPKQKKDLFNEAINNERLVDVKMPGSCEDLEATMKPSEDDTLRKMIEMSNDFDGTISLAPDKAKMQLVLNSTMNYDRLLDITESISPARGLLNITRDMNKTSLSEQNLTKLLYMSTDNFDGTVLAPKKCAEARELDGDQRMEDVGMEVDDMPKSDSGMYAAQIIAANPLQELSKLNKPRYSFGLDLTESTLDCSIELCDVSLASSAPAQVGSPGLKKQNSFEMDESLGILTPDQMKEFLDSTTNTNNLDLPINVHGVQMGGSGVTATIGAGGKLTMHQMRIDQTPSPEDLPLDPVGVKTDITDVIMSQELTQPQAYTQELSQTDSDSKTDQMTKSNVSKVSNSFITSVTSITSLDTGYQGDGEMSRPASRGAGDHSPSNGPRKPHLGRQPSFNQPNHPHIPIRRQDPMTDSDFFTESDADDIFHRGDRRAQVIDGQLYGPTLQAANVFITEQPQMEDSCMESSGIFTDVENRCDDDITQNRRDGDVDMSPDGSTDTVKSNNTEYNARHHHLEDECDHQQRSISPASQGHSIPLTKSRTSSTIQSSVSCERITTDEKQHDDQIGVTIKHSPQSTLSPGSTGSEPNANANAKTTDDKKPIASPSVKKLSPSRKHHGGTISAKNTTNANSRNTSSQLTSHLNGSCRTPSSPASRLKQSITLSEGICRANTNTNTTGDMLTKRRDDNAENKRPTISANGGNVNSVAGQSSSKSVPRKLSPNKWDAVMNKIAENKVFKKNYSDVKSKVATGVLRRTTTSPSVVNLKNQCNGQDNSRCGSVNSVSGLSTPQSNASSATKRLLPGATKRGRSFSKDSPQSSQSDLSLSGGSPKLQNKPFASTRSAKKRDVRTLSISPTDLGPPPKTQTNGGTPRTKQPIISQKRILPNAQPTTTASPVPGAKSSPPAKKVVSRRPQTQSSQQHVKAPLKDHNRLVSQQQTQQQQQQQVQNSNNSSSPKSGGIKTATTPTSPLSSCGGTTKPPTGANTRSSQSPPSPGLNKTTCSNNNTITICSPQSPSSIVQQDYKLQQKSDERQHNLAKELFNIHLSHTSRGVEALGVLLQYLVYDLDAFSCPKIKKEYEETRKKLFQTNVLLEDAKVACHDLQDQLHDKEAYYRARESELHSLHQCELKKVETSLSEIEKSAKERITALEQELLNKDVLHEKRFRDYVGETDNKFACQQRELDAARDKEQELLKRISVLSTTECELRDRVQSTESEFADRLRLASQREHELTDKINILNKQLDNLRQNTEHRERELEEKLNLSHDEISILRLSRSSLDQQPPLTPKNGTSSGSSANGNGCMNGPNKLQMLQDEVESLRCVLELKQSEISDLRKHNLELQRVADELPASQMKISALESRIEDLQIQLKARTEEEKELMQKNKLLQESYTHEVKNRNRLSLHNEELQWRLKQNSEKFALALTELSKSYQDQSGFLNLSKASIQSQDADLSSQNSSRLSLNRTNGSDRMVGCFQMDDVSPPTSPIIKGVVEKSDSVSWVLEMEDESPEALATRMIKRAGSFRSSFNEKCLMTKRQLSSSAQASLSVGNPLTQSASATSVLRQHSSDSVGLQQQNGGCATGTKPNSRTRSKSVNIKMSDQSKLMRQNSVGSGTSSSRKIELSTSWKEPVCSSSPYSRRYTRSPPKQLVSNPIVLTAKEGKSFNINRDNTFCDENESNLYRKPSRNLITCDTSALTSVERLEMRSMPSHPSVQDLKCLKKCQEIQESAGEAMVSGTNSEDEGCSASSDDTASSSASSSLGGKRHMSIEDALLMDKISTTSLGGTPMEVSWSEDADQYPSESIV